MILLLAISIWLSEQQELLSNISYHYLVIRQNLLAYFERIARVKMTSLSGATSAQR